MEIDWQNVTFEFDTEVNHFSTNELYQPSSNHQSVCEQIIQPSKRSRKEMEEVYPVEDPDQSQFLQNTTLESSIFENEYEDDVDVKYPQQIQHPEFKNKYSDVIYYCEPCSLDFASIAYFKRHQATKKHQRALKMEQSGKKLKQKRQYVRRNDVKLGNTPVRRITDINQIKQERIQEFTVKNNQFQSITDLTPEEITMLHMIDDQILKIESENTVKDFYENFNFDIDIEDEAPAAKIQKFSTIEEIMADLIASSEPILKVQQNRDNILIPRISQPIAQVQPQPTVQIQQYQTQVSINTENQKLKIQCQMCPRSFNLRCHFTQHMNIVHSGNRNFKCPKCGKKYPEQELLNQHMEKHSGDKPFKCTKCVKSYNNKVDLKRHEKTHEEVKDFICKYCGSGFVRSDHLEKHKLKHQRKMAVFRQ